MDERLSAEIKERLDNAKNILIVVLGILVVLFWLGDQSTDMDDRDPDIVFIEYKCSELLNYEYVPPEVLQECRERGLANRQHTRLIFLFLIQYSFI